MRRGSTWRSRRGSSSAPEALREQNLISQEEFDVTQGHLEASRARAAAAEARVNDRVITAPFAGVLGIRRVSPGALVSPGHVITTLDDLSVVKVDFTVPEALLAEVAMGQSVEGRAAPWPEEKFLGKVTGIDSRVDPMTRSVGMQARIPNPGGRLRTGMLLTVELTCCPRESPSVPERALLSYADRQYVYVVREDQTVEQREVKLGARDVGWVEIVEGLSPGETIVVDGLLNLRDGAERAGGSRQTDMILSEISIKRPVFATVISLVLITFGVIAYQRSRCASTRTSTRPSSASGRATAARRPAWWSPRSRRSSRAASRASRGSRRWSPPARTACPR